MLPRHLLVPFVALALLSACKSEQSPEGGKGAVNKVEPGKAPVAEPTPTPTTAVTTAAPTAGETGGDDDTDTGEVVEQPPLPDEFEKVGVTSCDEYVASYVACINDKVPEAEREAQRRLVFDNVSSWKQTAAGGGAAEKGLQTACKIATEQAKRATSAWGCAW